MKVKCARCPEMVEFKYKNTLCYVCANKITKAVLAIRKQGKLTLPVQEVGDAE